LVDAGYWPDYRRLLEHLPELWPETERAIARFLAEHPTPGVRAVGSTSLGSTPWGPHESAPMAQDLAQPGPIDTPPAEPAPLRMMLNAELGYLVNWLTHSVLPRGYGPAYVTEGGRIQIHSGGVVSRQPGRVAFAFPGTYHRDRGDTTLLQPLPEVVELHLTELGPSRVEIVADCYQPEVAPFLSDLLHELTERWGTQSPGAANADLASVAARAGEGASRRVPQALVAWPLGRDIDASPRDDSNRRDTDGKPAVRADDEAFYAELSGQDATIVRHWRSPKTAEAIAEIVDLDPQTVRNRVTTLRKIYGENRIPYHSPGLAPHRRRDSGGKSGGESGVDSG
jgi:hypothetical protein